MKTILYILLFCSCALFSCKDNQTMDIIAKETSVKWETFIIKLNNKTITVYFDKDTCHYHEIFREDTTYAKKHGHFNSESQEFMLTKNERDSLFHWAIDAITKPVLDDQSIISCGAGKYVSISLAHSNTKISCGYSNVDTWTGISPTMLKISSVTFDKIK